MLSILRFVMIRLQLGVSPQTANARNGTTMQPAVAMIVVEARPKP
jgi:hypothetical protein